MSEIDLNQMRDLVTTFIPVDPARGSWFALWDPAAPGGLLSPEIDGLSSADVELIVPADIGGTQSVMVRAVRLPMPTAIPLLAALRRDADVHPTTHAWAAVVRAGLGLVARGRLLPWVSPDGWDTWRVDPLDHDHVLHAEALASSLPALGHNVMIDRGRIADPRQAVRNCWDALGDRMVRSPAASLISDSAVFADRNPTRVRHLRPWVRDASAELCSATGLVIHMHPPGSSDSGFGDADDGCASRDAWRAVFALRSRLDPSLIVDAVDLWGTANELTERFGGQAEIDLLAGLRRASRACPLFAPVLHQAEPTILELGEGDIDELLEHLDPLQAVGIDVQWPADLMGPKLERKLLVTACAPGDSMRSLLELEGLLQVDWEFLLEGHRLTSTELAALSEAKRNVVSIRGKWIRLDPVSRSHLLAPVPDLRPGDAVAALLEGELSIGEGLLDERVAIEARGPMAKFMADIAALDTEGTHNDAVLAPGPGFEATLRPYQQRGLKWLHDVCARAGGGCLADDMGLGKTVQMLALHSLRRSSTLVICPTSLLANWQREAERFLPGVSVVRHHGPGRDVQALVLDKIPAAGRIVLTTYGVVRSDAEALAELEWDLVIADEAQFAKNPRSRTAKALRQIPSTARISLSGTPVENRLSELWSILDWSVPGLLPPLEEFKRTFAVPIERDGDPTATRRLHQLITPFLLRRRKSDPGIAPELPPKTERNVIVPLTEEQISLYQATTTETLADIADNDGITRHGLVLKLLTALKQITNHPAHYLGQRTPLPGRSGKLTALDEIIDAAAEESEPILVFTQYVAMGELLCQHLDSRGVGVGFLHGSQNIAARTELVDRFQRGEMPVLILSLRAGGTGLNLTAANHVVHYDRWWNPAVEDQATDRAHRIGQTGQVTVHRLITEGTVEDRVAELLEQKRALADRVVGAGEAWLSKLDDDDLHALIALDVPQAESVT